MNKNIIKKLQGDIGLNKTPLTKKELAFVKKSKIAGVLRRFGAILNHHKIGFAANCMVAWIVPAKEIEKIGKKLSQYDKISHCYERPAFNDFPYNAYTMMHGKSRKEIIDLTAKISKTIRVKDYCLLWSTKEIKKTSPVYVI